MARRSVTIQLDVPRELRYDFNALAEFEQAVGRSFASIVDGDAGMREIRAMLWCGLLHQNPKLTPREAGAMLEEAKGETMGERIRYVTEKIMEAFRLSGIVTEESEKNEAGPNANPST